MSDELGGYERALRHLRESILAGHMRPGDRIPGERELAGQLNVSRGAVREAIRVLQAHGVLESSPGPGRGTRIIAMQSEALGTVFSLHLATSAHSCRDLSETRVALERATASLAAEVRSREDLAGLEQLLDDMDAVSELRAFNRLDTQFHLRVAEIAGNPLLGDLTRAVREAMGGPILDASLQMAHWSDLRTRLCAEHRGVFEAIAAADPESAATLVEAHIRSASSALFGA